MFSQIPHTLLSFYFHTHLTDLNVLRTNATEVSNETAGNNVLSHMPKGGSFSLSLILCLFSSLVCEYVTKSQDVSAIACLGFNYAANTFMRFQLEQYLTNEPEREHKLPINTQCLYSGKQMHCIPYLACFHTTSWEVKQAVCKLVFHAF